MPVCLCGRKAALRHPVVFERTDFSVLFCFSFFFSFQIRKIVGAFNFRIICWQMTKTKIKIKKYKTCISGLLPHLHLLSCEMWHPRETKLLTIWQVWRLQMNPRGLEESTYTVSVPRKKKKKTLIKALKTQLIFAHRASRRSWRHLFSVSLFISSLGVLCNAHLRADGLICVRVNRRRTAAAAAAESKVLIAWVVSRPCFTRWFLV